MTPRDRFILALRGRQPPGRVPHFELVFFLTMEAFGRVHPSQRNYGQWMQMSDCERDLHRRDKADTLYSIHLVKVTKAKQEQDAKKALDEKKGKRN
jgi:uroporphyrinogen decarboxylase